MNSELIDACIAVIRHASGPLTAAQIASAVPGKKPQTAKLAEELGQLPPHSGVFPWPDYGKSKVFGNQPLANAVSDALVKALDAGPLTAAQAAAPVSKLLQRVSQGRALAELKPVARQLVEAKRILFVAPNKQTVVYFSFPYLQRLLPARATAPSIQEAILSAIENLQSETGNYVRIDHLRNAPEFRKPLDAAALALARAGKVVLGRYDGPRPVPEENKSSYIEDERGELYIGIALPRGERILA